jgi:hypothetical protein
MTTLSQDPKKVSNDSRAIATRGTIVVAVILFACFSFLIWLRFHYWMPKVLAADDLYNYMLYHGDRFQSRLSPVYFSETGQKFRFVFINAMRIESFLFGPEPHLYFAMNVFIHAICGVAFYFLALSLSQAWWTALLLSAIAVTCRFEFYQVSHLTGQVESLSLVFCLLSILAAKRSLDRNWSAGWMWTSLLLAFLALSAHERYVVLIAWLAFFFVFHSQAGSVKRRILFAAGALLLLASNVLTKVFVYKSNVLEGTGNTHLAVNFSSIKTLLLEAVLSIIGINHGPQYLVGAEWADFSTAVRAASTVLATLMVGLVIIALVKGRSHDTAGNVHWPAAFFVLAALLLVPPALTIRMEPRWEVASFYLLLLIIACGIAEIRSRHNGESIAALLLILIAASTIIVEHRVTQSFDSVFFVPGDRYAEAVKQDVVDVKATKIGEPIGFVADQGYCDGALLDGGFFVIYEGHFRTIKCFASRSALGSDSAARDMKVYELTAPNRMVEVSKTPKQ